MDIPVLRGPRAALLVMIVTLLFGGGAAGALSFWEGIALGGMAADGISSASRDVGASALSAESSGARSPAELAQSIVRDMSEEDLLGQVLFLGYQGDRLSDDIIRWISKRHIGGVKIFPRNVSSLQSLARDVAAMQKLAGASPHQIPLFVATDQEGGWVRQIKDETSIAPGNLALGAAGIPLDAYLTGYYLGLELAALGINMNFAPTADVYLNPEASVIGPRSFGSDPSMTGLLSAAWARGMTKAGILCVAKHFPGHGSADTDSHGRLPVITESLDALLRRDLVPYSILIREGIPAIMTAHLAFSGILDNLTPASLSPLFLRTILRDTLGFQGIVITDDMEMEGVLMGGIDTPAACLRAIEAGTDMVLVSHTPDTQERTWARLLKQMKADPSFRQTIAEAATRVILTKLTFFQGAGSAAPMSKALDIAPLVPAPGAKDFFFQSSLRSVTAIAGSRIPFNPAQGERILLCGQFPEFLAEGRRRFPAADTAYFPFMPFYNARPEDVASIPAVAKRYDTVIFCLSNYNSLEILQRLKAMGSRVIVISALSPVYLSETPWVETAIAVYGNSNESFQAGFAALAGDFQATGRLPLQFGESKDP